MSHWVLPMHLAARVHLATGGTVRDIEEDLREVLQEVAFREFGREIHACPYRRFSAHAIM